MDDRLSADVLFFFDGHPGALALFGALAEGLLAEYTQTEIRVKKTQISFFDGHVYACASLTPVRRRAERPEPFLTVTFGLDIPLDSPRLVCVPIRPNRFTHHAMIGDPGGIDGELMGWLREAHDFANR